MILFLFLPLELLLGPDHDISIHTLGYFTSRPLSLIIFQLSEVHIIFSFCSQASKAKQHR